VGRQQSWNEHELLGRVMAVFRAKGFSQTTVRDLCEATGLHPGSIYKAYGNKDGLFAAVLRAYCERVVRARVQTHLTDSEDPLQGIRSFFTSTFEKSPHPDQGCLITNSAVDGVSLEPEARAAVSAGLETIERGLEGALVRMQKSGQIPASTSPRRVAAQLLALYQGVLVLLRARTTAANLRSLIDDGLLSIIGNGRISPRKNTKHEH
jgi:TetR/AcrR family transcriptional repressor of nem operon